MLTGYFQGFIILPTEIKKPGSAGKNDNNKSEFLQAYHDLQMYYERLNEQRELRQNYTNILTGLPGIFACSIPKMLT